MSYYPVDYSASGQPRVIRNGRLLRQVERSQRVPTDVYDVVHSSLKHLTFFFFGTRMPGSLWPYTCRVMSQLKSRILLPRVVYQTEKHALGSAQNLRSGRFNLEFRCHPPSKGGLLRSGRIALRSCRASISSMMRRRPDTPAAIAEAAFGVSWMRQRS
jgi:hypothetical protein